MLYLFFYEPIVDAAIKLPLRRTLQRFIPYSARCKSVINQWRV